MRRLFQQIRVGTVTEDAVKGKTGKTWDEWCKILDKAGARMMDHQEIALFLHKQLGLSLWWAQMVAVGYENERGLRADKRSGPNGQKCEVTLNKTVPASRAAVWAAWQDRNTLERWLPGADFAVTKTVPLKILHLDWPPETRVIVRLYERRGQARVVVSHGRLADEDVEDVQRYWLQALDRLRLVVARPPQ